MGVKISERMGKEVDAIAPKKVLKVVEEAPKHKESASADFDLEELEKVTDGLLGEIISSGETPSAIVAEEPEYEEVSSWLSTPHGFLEGLTSTDGSPTELAEYQIKWMAMNSRFRIWNKSRQIGASFACSGEALAKALSRNKYTAIFCSFNLEESKEKIKYARELYESLPTRWKLSRKKVVDNQTSLEFEGGSSHRARLISHPQRDIRGKGGNVDVYLDEIAHYVYQDKIYVSAIPVINRGGGVLSLMSTPLGAGGTFWEVDTENNKPYPHFKRINTPWWECPEFCNNIERAKEVAEFMDTPERVEEFGKEILRLSYESFSDLDDFRQEYELHYVDENISMFPYDLLKTCQRDIAVLPVYTDVEELVKYLQSYGKSFRLFAGFDVGRKKDKSEVIIVLEERDPSIQKVCFMITMTNKSFDFQKTKLREIIQCLPVSVSIDCTGLGMNIAEDLKKEFPDRVKPVTFTLESKKRMVGNILIRFQNKMMLIPLNKDLARQIHSVKKNVTPSGDITYTVENEKGHHGDKFWALALASSMGRNLKQSLGSIPTLHEHRVIPIHSKREFSDDPSFKLGKVVAP